jgi:hypothetical protein
MKTKTSFALILALIMAISMSMVAVADPDVDPIVTITSDTGSFTVVQGNTLNLTATSIMANFAQDWQLKEQTWTGATRTGGNEVGDVLNSTAPPTQLQFVSNAQFSAVGLEPGLYSVKYEITVTRLAGNKDGSSYDEVEITVTGDIPVVVDYPAAPAIAARLLRENGVCREVPEVTMFPWLPSYMGPQTDFDGVAKSDAAAYEAAVDDLPYAKRCLLITFPLIVNSPKVSPGSFSGGFLVYVNYEIKHKSRGC